MCGHGHGASWRCRSGLRKGKVVMAASFWCYGAALRLGRARNGGRLRHGDVRVCEDGRRIEAGRLRRSRPVGLCGDRFGLSAG